MRFITTPRKYIKAKKALHERALTKMLMPTFDVSVDECIQKIYSLKYLFADVHGVPGTIEEGLSLGIIEDAYSHFLAGALNWSLGRVVTKEKDPSCDYVAVVSPKNEYLIYSASLVLLAFRSQRDLMVDLYEKIKNGQLPPSEPDKFLDLGKYFYEDKNKEEFIPFDPLEKEDREEWFSFAQKGAAIFNVTLDSEYKPISTDVKEIILNIEKEILKHKSKFDEFAEEDYLKSLSSLYGQCLKAATNWELAITWMETDEGIEGMPVLHSPDKRYWISPYATVYRELVSRRKSCRLVTFFQRIKNNKLSPPETDDTEEIK